MRGFSTRVSALPIRVTTRCVLPLGTVIVSGIVSSSFKNPFQHFGDKSFCLEMGTFVRFSTCVFNSMALCPGWIERFPSKTCFPHFNEIGMLIISESPMKVQENRVPFLVVLFNLSLLFIIFAKNCLGVRASSLKR